MKTITETNNYRITRQDIKAFKSADNICFRYRPGEHNKPAVSVIDWTINEKVHGQEIEVTYGFPVDSEIRDSDLATPEEVFNTYGKEMDACLAVTQYKWETGIIKTISKFLKVGDIIRLEWHRNNNSEMLERHDFVTDSLSLRIIRNEGKKDFLFHIEDRTMHRHCDCRMILRRYEGQFQSRAWLYEDGTPRYPRQASN